MAWSLFVRFSRDLQGEIVFPAPAVVTLPGLWEIVTGGDSKNPVPRVGIADVETASHAGSAGVSLLSQGALIPRFTRQP